MSEVANTLTTIVNDRNIPTYVLPDAVAQNIKAVPTEELKSQLARILSVTAQQLMYLAFIWRELEERGEDLSDLKSGLAVYLPLIAAGRLDADLVVKYAGQTMLLRAMSSLSIQDQRRLAQSGEIDLATVGTDGNMEIQKIPLAHIPVKELRLVFGEGFIRPTQEQFDMRRGATRRRGGRIVSAPKPKYAQVRRVEVDADREQLIVGDVATDLSRVLAALSEYYGFDVSKTIEDALKPARSGV